MKNTIKFKDPSSVIYLQGGEKITQANLTDEKYEELVKRSPSYAEQFEKITADESKAKKA